jgi:hypothetical protein
MRQKGSSGCGLVEFFGVLRLRRSQSARTTSLRMTAKTLQRRINATAGATTNATATTTNAMAGATTNATVTTTNAMAGATTNATAGATTNAMAGATTNATAGATTNAMATTNATVTTNAMAGATTNATSKSNDRCNREGSWYSRGLVIVDGSLRFAAARRLRRDYGWSNTAKLCDLHRGHA